MVNVLRVWAHSVKQAKTTHSTSNVQWAVLVKTAQMKEIWHSPIVTEDILSLKLEKKNKCFENVFTSIK